MLNTIDLFAGPGGWDTGLQTAGVPPSVGIELDPYACATGRAAGYARVQADVTALDPEAFWWSIEGLVASPPCQGFSNAGTGNGRSDIAAILKGVGEFAAGRDPRPWLRERCADHRSVLVLEPLRYVLALRPEWLAWEQVPAVLPLWQACAEALRDLGYSVWAEVLHAEQYGVPQTRRRAILMASRISTVAPPVPTHSRYYPRDPQRLDPGVQKWVSMAEALGWTESTITGAEDFRERHWAFDRPATTVQGDPRLAAPGHRCMTPDCHPDREPESMFAKATRVSVAEAAVLQSFPCDYPFQGSRTRQYQQIGDAVPPLLAANVVLSGYQARR